MDEETMEQIQLVVNALITIIREEWPEDISIYDIVYVSSCSAEQIEAIRRFTEGGLPIILESGA
jgi:hypothetical protein